MKSQLVEQTGSLRLVESKNLRKGCLGRLEGVCADFENPTRNGRKYGLKLWKNVFNNSFVKEALNTKTLFGELDHPEDRFEVLAKYACVCMTDYTIDENDGVVYGGFDILDTEAGRILKSLIDYGSQMGVSSRGEGDIIQGESGEEVDPDTYDFACFDVVSTPAVAKARQTVVESVEQSKKKRCLIESIEKEIKHTDTIDMLNNIERTVTNCNIPNLNRIKRSIKNRKSEIVEGKTISSKATNSNDSRKANLLNNKSAKTVRDNLEKLSNTESIQTLNERLHAYKIKEKHYKKIINDYQLKVEQLNQKVCSINESLDSCNNVRNKAVESSKKLKRTITTQSNDLKLLETTNNRLTRQNNIIKNDRRKQLQEAELQKKRNQELQSELVLLKEENQNLTAQVQESSSIIESYKLKQQQLKDSLKEQQDNTKNYQETISDYQDKVDNQETDITELENSYNNLCQENTELQEKYDRLLESYTTITTKDKQLIEKLQKSLQLNKQYTNSFLSTYANSCGVNPKSVTLNESIVSPKKIKQLVTEVKDRQDRYNQLPISYDEPTKVGILTESVGTNNLSEEDKQLERFLTDVQSQF